MLEPALDYEGYLGIGDKAVTMEWDGVVPSRGRDSKSGSECHPGGRVQRSLQRSLLH